MKKSINQRMAFLKGFMAFTLILFASTMCGEAFAEIGTGVANMFEIPSLSDGISLVSQLSGASLATVPVLFTLKGDAFEIKSAEQLKAMKTEEQEIYYSGLVEAQSQAILKLQKDLTEKGEEDLTVLKQLQDLKDTQYKTMETVMKNMGLEIEKLKMGDVNLPASKIQQIQKWIGDNAAEIKKMHGQGSGFIELTVKAVGPITTGSALNPDGIPEIVGVQTAAPSNVNLKDTIVDALVTTINTTQPAYAYTETIPKDGDFAFIAEGLIKPQIDFKIETRYAEPVKVAAYEVLTTESVQDVPGLQSIAQDFLRKKHNLKRQSGILFGDGIAPNPKGATVYGRTFVAGSMLNKVANANIMDVINACITDVYTTQNYQDETPYMPSLAMMNPVNFFIEFVSAKDGNGLPLFPQAGLFNRVTIGGVTIMPFMDIPAGKIFVADMSKYNVTNYVDYTVKIGWINDQLITNQFTMVGESRFHAFVKKLDEQAFIYDTIATVKAAILKP